MTAPGYNVKIKEERKNDIWLNDLRFEKIYCDRCSGEMGYMHDGGAGEYNIDVICYRCAKIIHYQKMGMFEYGQD